MNFWSQFFPERSAHEDGLNLFLADRVHFREGDIDDLEQRCPLARYLQISRSEVVLSTKRKSLSLFILSKLFCNFF